MTTDDLKKDCERKAREKVDKLISDWFVDHPERDANTTIYSNTFRNKIVELLLSEHLIVQKREEQLSEKMHSLEVENCAMHIEVDKVQKRVEELCVEVAEWICETCNTVYPTPKKAKFNNPCPTIGCHGQLFPKGIVERHNLQKQIDKLKKENEWLKQFAPKHGPCCTCQVCGKFYDDCRCMEDELHKKIDELTKQVEAGRAAAEAIARVYHEGVTSGHLQDMVHEALTQCREAGLLREKT